MGPKSLISGETYCQNTVFINSATCSCIQQSNYFCYSQAIGKFVEKSSHNLAQSITLEKVSLLLDSATDNASHTLVSLLELSSLLVPVVDMSMSQPPRA